MMFTLFCVSACAGPQTSGHSAPKASKIAISRGSKSAPVVLPVGVAKRRPVVIRDATIWTGDGQVLMNSDVLIVDGKIASVGRGVQRPQDAVVIEAKGRVLTPGLVDMHSHLGVYSAPHASAHSDGNEMTSPLTPMVRAVDSYDPEDPAIAKALAGGVTTSLILPGSGNIMGGEAAYVKLRGRTTGQQLLPRPPRAMKMAMGENPKRYYGSKGRMPRSRMGHAWLMRKQLQAAEALKRKQDKWDADAGKRTGRRPADRGLDLLVALLRGEVYLQVHCYEVHDIETLLRVMDEFGVQVAAIHHALEAWKIPKLLRRKKVGVATFADLWGFKMEAYDASVRGPSVLANAGVKLAIKSDHPVLPAETLMHEAAKAHHHGLSAQQALAAVTRIPAELIGLGDRLGTITRGKEGDVVLWDSPPLTTLGARPTHVLVDGVLWVSPAGNLQSANSGAPHPLTSSPCGCGMEAL